MQSTVALIRAKRRMWIKVYLEAKRCGRSLEVVKARHKALHYCEYVHNWEKLECQK